MHHFLFPRHGKPQYAGEMNSKAFDVNVCHFPLSGMGLFRKARRSSEFRPFSPVLHFQIKQYRNYLRAPVSLCIVCLATVYNATPHLHDLDQSFDKEIPFCFSPTLVVKQEKSFKNDVTLRNLCSNSQVS